MQRGDEKRVLAGTVVPAIGVALIIGMYLMVGNPTLTLPGLIVLTVGLVQQSERFGSTHDATAALEYAKKDIELTGVKGNRDDRALELGQVDSVASSVLIWYAYVYVAALLCGSGAGEGNGSTDPESDK